MRPPHLPGEGSWTHEMKQAIGDKLRKAYSAAKVSPAAATAPRKEQGMVSKNSGEACRVSSFEDPIRRLMFLGPWSHT